jgi:hypothetical protein
VLETKNKCRDLPQPRQMASMTHDNQTKPPKAPRSRSVDCNPTEGREPALPQGCYELATTGAATGGWGSTPTSCCSGSDYLLAFNFAGSYATGCPVVRHNFFEKFLHFPFMVYY